MQQFKQMEQVGQSTLSGGKGAKPRLDLLARHQLTCHADESRTQPEETVLLEPGEPLLPLSLIIDRARQVIPRHAQHPRRKRNFNLAFVCRIADSLEYLFQ